jgi:hypothetical protein
LTKRQKFACPYRGKGSSGGQKQHFFARQFSVKLAGKICYCCFFDRQSLNFEVKLAGMVFFVCPPVFDDEKLFDDFLQATDTESIRNSTG